MTYYELATVKKYKRKNNKDSTQINLGVNSKFPKDTKVVVIGESDFNNLINNNNDDLKDEVDELKNKLIKEKDEKEKLLIKIATVQDKKLKISDYENNIKDKDRLIENKENVIKTLTQNWVWYKRIFNILPGGINLNDTEDE